MSEATNNSMEQSLEQHPMMALLESMDGRGQLERGDVITGHIALVNDNEILVDVGAKSEGVLAAREFSDMSREDRARFEAGQTVECMVINTEDRAGHLVVSFSQAKMGLDWDRAEELFNSDEAFEELVSGHNKGGLIVHLGSVRGFVPASQIDRRHAIDRSMVDGSGESPLADLVGRPITVKVIEIDRRKNRLILSEQAAMREQRKKKKADLLDRLEEGQVVEGIVTSLADFGAFVDIGGADGLVHLSELAWHRVSHPKEIVRLGQKVTVKVISVDLERKRIGLSMKQLEPEPWSDLEERFQVGSVVQGEITRLADFGAFARIDGDVEGLIHVSELSDEELPPEQVVSPGDEVALRIIRIDTDKRRLGLSLKRAGDEYDQILDDSAAAFEAAAAAEDGAAVADPAEAVVADGEADPEPVAEAVVANDEALAEPVADADVADGTEHAEPEADEDTPATGAAAEPEEATADDPEAEAESESEG